MTPMLEKVARAILEADVRASAADYPDVPMAQIVAAAELLFREHHVPMAIAAVRALREPDDAMLGAFNRHCDEGGSCLVKTGYRAMIDSILADTGDGE